MINSIKNDTEEWNQSNIINSSSSITKEISNDVKYIYEKYKVKIEEIINNSYWTNKEDEILMLFKKLGVILSDRNNELLLLLENKYWLNFKLNFDFSWWITFEKRLLDWVSQNISSFFNNWYTRNEWEKIHSRWYWYYFNFPWLTINEHNRELDIKKYTESLTRYYLDITKYLWEFNWKNLSNLNESEKKLLWVWLEHYKNLLLFFQNFIISVSDKKYLSKHVLNISEKAYNTFYEDIWNLDNFNEVNVELTKEIERIINIFWDFVLWLNSDQIINVNENNGIKRWIEIMKELFGWTEKKQIKFIESLKKRQKSWKQTDFVLLEKQINKTNNKLIWKLMRILREEDNPIKQLLACHNIAQNIPDEIQSIDSTWVLYWWIEMPYFMKYILTRFCWKSEEKIDVSLIWLSNYNNRNLKQVSTIWNYKILDNPKDVENDSKLQIMLDDNIYHWMSLQVAWNIWASKWPVYSWVSEIWLRRTNIWKLSEWSNINFLLSKVSNSASVTPIQRNNKTYMNLVNKYIKSNLPKLVWRY